MSSKATLGNLIGSWQEKCELTSSMNIQDLTELIKEFLDLPLDQKDPQGYSVYNILLSTSNNPNISPDQASQIVIKILETSEYPTSHPAHRKKLALLWTKAGSRKAQVLGFEYLFCDTSSFIKPDILQALSDSPMKNTTTFKELFYLTIPRYREAMMEINIKDWEYILIRVNSIFSPNDDTGLISAYTQLLNKVGPSIIYKSFKRDPFISMTLTDQEMDTYLKMTKLSCEKFNAIDHEQIKKINNPFGIRK